ncbi:hypothetical protein [Caldisericum sp.]
MKMFNLSAKRPSFLVLAFWPLIVVKYKNSCNKVFERCDEIFIRLYRTQ